MRGGDTSDGGCGDGGVKSKSNESNKYRSNGVSGSAGNKSRRDDYGGSSGGTSGRGGYYRILYNEGRKPRQKKKKDYSRMR